MLHAVPQIRGLQIRTHLLVRVICHQVVLRGNELEEGLECPIMPLERLLQDRCWCGHFVSLGYPRIRNSQPQGERDRESHKRMGCTGENEA